MKQQGIAVDLDDIDIRNAAKTLFANIRFASPDNPVRLVSVTSSIPNEGKTTVAIELAKTIAMSGSTVCIVEVDMHRRSLAGALRTHPAHGSYAVLSGETTLDMAVAPTAYENLWFLDVEPGIPNPADVLSSNRYRSLVRDLHAMFDYVVFDTPPVGVFVDAAILAGLVDGTVFVCRRGAVKRDDMVKAFQQLRAAGGVVLGAVQTFTEKSSNSYYGSKYYSEDARTPELPRFVDAKPAGADPLPVRRTAKKPSAAKGPRNLHETVPVVCGSEKKGGRKRA
jgi:capsular exopolysaccharide synthesis family protein